MPSRVQAAGAPVSSLGLASLRDTAAVSLTARLKPRVCASGQRSLISEVVLQRELNQPQLAGAANAAEPGRRSRALRAPARARAAPCGMVRRVEHLHAELQGMPFVDMEVLDGGEIHVPGGGSNQVIAATVSKLSRNGV